MGAGFAQHTTTLFDRKSRSVTTGRPHSGEGTVGCIAGDHAYRVGELSRNGERVIPCIMPLADPIVGNVLPILCGKIDVVTDSRPIIPAHTDPSATRRKLIGAPVTKIHAPRVTSPTGAPQILNPRFQPPTAVIGPHIGPRFTPIAYRRPDGVRPALITFVRRKVTLGNNRLGRATRVSQGGENVPRRSANARVVHAETWNPHRMLPVDPANECRGLRLVDLRHHQNSERGGHQDAEDEKRKPRS